MASLSSTGGKPGGSWRGWRRFSAAKTSLEIRLYDANTLLLVSPGHIASGGNTASCRVVSLELAAAGLMSMSLEVIRINGAARPPSPSVEILPATSFTVEPIRWIWSDWLALGKLHLLAGAPGTGKTTIALSIASTITTGNRIPDGVSAEQGDVLIWTGGEPKNCRHPPASSAGCWRRPQQGAFRQFDAGGRCPLVLRLLPRDAGSWLGGAEAVFGLKLVNILDPVVAGGLWRQPQEHGDEARKESQLLILRTSLTA